MFCHTLTLCDIVAKQMAYRRQPWRLLTACTSSALPVLCAVLYAGSLPSSWSYLSNSTATTLLLGGNLLQGNIPDTWGSKGTSSIGSGWQRITLDNNP
jgi:hypothetical protein